jgi:hypothetical protein
MKNALAVLTILAAWAAPVRAADEEILALVPEAYRSGVSRALSGRNGSALAASFRILDEEERVGWAFLLANMAPHRIPDLTEEILTEHVRYAWRARRELAWTKTLPEEIFLHYVLPILSGDEKVEAYRKLLWDEIVPRLRRKRCRSLEQVALEVNRFCGSKVSFKATPPEDSSPLEVMARGYGRCEEEGIFYNAVARTAGLPARVASTPYWTFKASNHAWCEVYTGGDRGRPWHYLGACEPAGKLDQAWFTGDVKRAALVLSRAIGKPESEQVLSTRGTSSVINSTRYYTRTCEMTVRVADSEGRPAGGADLTLYIWNEVGNEPCLRSAFQARTDGEGRLTFDLGPGDYVVHAKSGGEWGWAVARSTPGRKAECEIVLGTPAASDAKREPGNGLRLVLGPGGRDLRIGVCRLSAFPWKPERFVAARQSLDLSPGTWLVQTGRRKGDSEIHVTLQAVEVRAGERTTLMIPSRFPKRAPREPDGSGRYILTYPR